MSIDFDKFGHCVLCHKDLIVERTIDGKVQRMLSPEYETTEFLLDDESRMRVCVCKPCKIDLKPEQENAIMSSVIKGWDKEAEKLENLGYWKPEQRKKHMDIYSKKKIIAKSEGVSPHGLRKKFKEYKNNKHNKI